MKLKSSRFGRSLENTVAQCVKIYKIKPVQMFVCYVCHDSELIQIIDNPLAFPKVG